MLLSWHNAMFDFGALIIDGMSHFCFYYFKHFTAFCGWNIVFYNTSTTLIIKLIIVSKWRNSCWKLSKDKAKKPPKPISFMFFFPELSRRQKRSFSGISSRTEQQLALQASTNANIPGRSNLTPKVIGA